LGWAAPSPWTNTKANANNKPLVLNIFFMGRQSCLA
jgi:hypothetical protein